MPRVTMPVLLVLALLLPAVFSGCTSREDSLREARERCRNVIGVWANCYVDSSVTPPVLREPSGLHWIDVDEDGDLRLRLHAELRMNVTMHVDDHDISFDDGVLNLWDEFIGRPSEDGESIPLTYTGWDGRRHAFLFRRVHGYDTLRMLKRIYGEHDRPFVHERVPDLRDGIPTASFAAVDVDSLPLLELLEDVRDGDFGDIHAILMMKDGRLFLEEYFGAEGRLHGNATAAFVRSRGHSIQSVSKSILSTVVGIAIAEGLVPGTDTPVRELFPEYNHLLAGGKRDMTLHHLLAMNCGLEWNGLQVSMTDSTNDTHRMLRSHDPLAFLFSRPLRLPPGLTFNYNNGCYHAVQELLDRRLPGGTGAYAQRVLFTPLGMGETEWRPAGAPVPLARDLARFGLLCLRNGEWNGARLVPAEWLARATTNHQRAGLTPYGYFWWLREHPVAGRKLRCVDAIGDGGQHVLLFPDIDFLIVVLAGNYQRRVPGLAEALERRILPAVMGGNDRR